VMDHQPAVGRRVDIQLHAVGAERHGRPKRVESILRGVPGSPAMGERSRNHQGVAIRRVDMFTMSRWM
jgi:hypothetical protein